MFCGPDEKSYLRQIVKEIEKQTNRKIPDFVLGSNWEKNRKNTTETLKTARSLIWRILESFLEEVTSKILLLPSLLLPQTSYL